ncbi:SDR family oxidoreductase [Caballeronia sp. LZ001]|uniref:SDR family NAD(P)-dependent oxidoreductase n=1 Tax=Caballeronia sp. LZ001 TaxID=3038553 RepID=UPI00285F9C15|nr:SDR family oxidoreductase [Caballeronia sp. LZ001]MDR5804853.1 SDR family oxidoreductase [Caballeronia sp. LZ001]
MKQLVDFSSRTVIVTGAGQGIGRCAAQLFHDLGANLALIERNAETAEELRGSFAKERTLVLVGSVTDREFVEKSVATVAGQFGGVHGLLNNAGITRTAMTDKMTADQWQQVIDVNLTGVFNCLQAVGKEMIERNKAGDANPGAIVNISSDAGRRGTIGQINYGAAKAGVLGLTMSAAREWGRYGIRVNTVSYGVVETEMTEVIRGEKFRERSLSSIPLGRFLKPEEAVNSVAFLLSEAAVHITGQHLSVNGGSHIGF